MGAGGKTAPGIYRERVAAGGANGLLRRSAVRGCRAPAGLPDGGSGSAGNGQTNAIESGAAINAQARLSGVVWSDVKIEGGAVLDDCIVAGVSLPDGFRADSAVLP